MSKTSISNLVSRLSLLIILSFFFTTVRADNAPDPGLVSKGEVLFKENCKTCHAVHTQEVGPALKDVTKRRDVKWLSAWIRNSSQVIASGDKYANDLYNKFGKSPMTSFSSFKDDEIKAVLAYIDAESVKGPEKKEEKVVIGEPPVEKVDTTSTIILILVVVVLILVLTTLIVFLSVIKRFLKDKEATLTEADKELVNQKFDLVAVVKSKMFITIVSLLFVTIAVRACWLGALSIGVEQNYEPVQPIPFSHKQHAGEMKINCNYCHTGAYKSKQANIPSVNICMNCHTHVKEGPRFGAEGIAKVVKAYETGAPIKWVRVHNLPDLAYFNHSQHTTVAGIECQKCHGPIEEMEVVRQHSPLTMGWCINCHRETAVNSKDNAYYDKLLKVHADSKKKGEMKAEDIGAIDCSKCHY
ncbi:MAG: quinol:cytochrome c oxidoreductase pentaheme cytochrome subunit [Chitinophagaceae bacterium]|nr:quinol:cytochrome c oxidoreductase pentaheme cytochrome subunit [Chitinophagaceae bacterium]